MLDAIVRPVTLAPDWMARAAPCDLFNAHRMLLVRAGQPIPARLCAEGHAPRVFCAAPAARHFSTVDPVALLHEAAATLTRISARLARHDAVSAGELKALVASVMTAWQADADACLGTMRLSRLGAPSVHHALHVGLITAELAHIGGQSEGQLTELVGGALTMNLATHALHDAMFACSHAPDADARAAISRHPAQSVALLEHIGRFNAPWLDSVGQHHENIDGSGYPHGLARTEIALSARCVRVADTFAARLSGRKSRPPLYWNIHHGRDLPRLAQHIFGQDMERLDTSLVNQLMRAIGRFPPGGMVRLSNNELAIVTRRMPGAGSHAQEVFVVADARGRALPHPRARAVGPAAQDIQITQYAHDDLARLPERDWAALWGYEA